MWTGYTDGFYDIFRSVRGDTGDTYAHLFDLLQVRLNLNPLLFICYAIKQCGLDIICTIYYQTDLVWKPGSINQ